MTVLTGAEIWRKYAVAGVPASGPHRPDKADIVPWATWLESMLASGAAGLAKATLALLAADIYRDADSTAVVYADPNPANNGFYVKGGVSGDGSWTRIGDLPGDVIRLTVTGGTGNAIVATAPVTPSVPGDKLYLMTPSANCTGASTIAVNGAAAAPIKTALASDTVTGSLVANSPVLMAWQVDHYQLLVSLPVDASGILNDAIAARTGAQTAQAAAEAAAAALGNQLRTYDTVVQAQGATIPVGVNNIRVVRDATNSRLANRTYVPGVVSDPGAFAEAGGHYWKPDFSALPTEALFSSRAGLAAATVPPLLNVALCFGYAAAGDCTPFLLKRVTSAPRFGGIRSTDRYLPSGAVDNTNGGWWVYVPGPAGVDVCAFGYVADWNGDDSVATDNTAALQEAINFAAQSFGNLGVDTGGGYGNHVLLPKGTGLIKSKITVHNGVRFRGKGVSQTILKMWDSFSTTSHVIRLGTPGDASAVCLSQTRGSAGNLVVNGSDATGGIATFFTPAPVTIYSTGNDTGITFTVTGKNLLGGTMSAVVSGSNAGKATTGGPYFAQVTSVAVSGATAANVTVGREPYAAFECSVEDMQLFATALNATSGTSMIYTDNAQHIAGVRRLRIFGGNRVCLNIQTGTGGASYITIEDIETFNHGSEVGVAANNPQIILNYAGPLLTPLKSIVVQGPDAGAASVGILIQGGRCRLEDVHVEHVAQGIVVSVASLNAGWVIMQNIIGGAGMDALVHMDSLAANNVLYYSALDSNSATLAIKDDRVGKSNLGAGLYLPWTLI